MMRSQIGSWVEGGIQKAITAVRNITHAFHWKLPDDGCIAVFDDDGQMQLRSLRGLLILFEMIGYNVYVRMRPNRRTLQLSRLVDWHRNLKFTLPNSKTKKTDLLVTSRVGTDADLSRLAEGRIIQILYDCSPPWEPTTDEFVFQMTMHPQIYVQYRAHERLDIYRGVDRKVRLFFAGNWSEDGYADYRFNSEFDVLGRHSIISHLITTRRATVIEDIEGLYRLLDDTYRNEVVILDTRLDQAEWLDVMARADFFLSPPGIRYPPSHNAVEAMAVGTIPLINYPDWFFPSLEDGNNCIAFTDLVELDQRIDLILSMSKEDIAALRKGALDYYTDHLSLRQLGGRLVESPSKLTQLHVMQIT